MGHKLELFDKHGNRQISGVWAAEEGFTEGTPEPAPADKVFKLFTSNQAKLQEYRNFGFNQLEAFEGADIKEVQGTDLEVITYKVLQLPENTLAEDTSLAVEGADIGVNVRYMLDNLKDYVGRKAVFKVMIGKWEQNHVNVYTAELSGTIVEPQEVVSFMSEETKFSAPAVGGYAAHLDENEDLIYPQPVFGFDNCFAPDGGGGATLYTLALRGRKDEFSPRKKAIERVLNYAATYTFEKDTIPAWEGAYQNE